MRLNRKLFGVPNAPYYIYAPPFSRVSGSGRALHYLCHALNLAGEDAYVTDTGSAALRTPLVTQDVINGHLQSGLDPIVIYPEVVSGNPLDARNVVRYLLNIPGAATAAALQWGPNDKIFSHRNKLAPAGMQAQLLQTPLVDDSIFNSHGVDDATRKGALLWIDRYPDPDRRGNSDPITNGAVLIRRSDAHRSQEEMAALFRRSEIMFSYEPSVACYEAMLCGCPVVYLPNNDLLTDPDAVSHYLGRAGWAWGTAPSDIAYAKASVHEVAAAYGDLEAAFPPQLDAFIDATQQRVPTGLAPRKPLPAAVAAATAVKKAERKKRILVYTVESTWSPCPQIRLIRPFAHLGDRWELVWGLQNGTLNTEAAADADLIIMHRFTPGLMPLSSLEYIFKLGKPVIYESDDLLNEIPHDHPEATASASWKAGIEYSVRHAKAVVVSTHFLADKYRALNPAVHVLPNYLDFDIFFRPVPDNRSGTITIGLLGSSIQPSNFALVNDALHALCARYGSRLKLYFVGWECPAGWANHPNVQFLTFIHEYENYAAQLKQWDWDIALIPLAKDEYNQCKSYIKWLDYSAAGIASIFSDVSVYNEVVTHDVTGLLMPNSEQAWLTAITMLIESPTKRHALASAGQREVKADFDLREKAVLYDKVYGDLVTYSAVATHA